MPARVITGRKFPNAPAQYNAENETSFRALVEQALYQLQQNPAIRDTKIRDGFAGALLDNGGAVYNIRHPRFGAIGDGTTDDSAAVQAAIDAAEADSGYAVVWVPPGTYAVGTTLTIDGSKVVVDGPGTIKALSGLGTQGSVFTVTGTDSVIRGIEINQNNLNTGRSITLNGSGRITIDGVRSTNVQQAFIRMTGVVTETFIFHCHHRSRGFGVWVDDPSASSKGLYISDNEFFFSESTGRGDGIEINCPTNGFTRYIVANNVVRGYIGETFGTGLGIAAAKADHGVIVGNFVQACEGDGIHVEDGSDHVVIIGNTIEDTGVASPSGGNGNGIYCGECRSVQIIGNNIHNVDSAYGIIVRADLDGSVQEYLNIIRDNHLRVIDRGGIRIHGQAEFICDGNTILGASQETNATWAGIEVVQIGGSTAISQDGCIRNNTVRDSGNATLAGIWVSSSEHRMDISGNRLANVTTKINVNSGTNHAQYNNWFSTGARQGRATLSSGTVTVNTAEVVASDNIVLTRVVAGGTLGDLSVGTITAGTSFVINSSSGSDTSTIFWEIRH